MRARAAAGWGTVTWLRRLARRIRHLPGLERAEGLWRLVRAPYERLLDSGGRGVAVRVGGAVTVRIPAAYASADWEAYEPETVAAIADWLSRHPGALVLDAGCSVGVLSAVALFADSSAEVVAVDSDLPSLAATRRMCGHAGGSRLRVVNGFLVARDGSGRPLDAAVAETLAALAAGGHSGDPGTTRYVCLAGDAPDGIPRHRIDDLMAAAGLRGRPVLLKCDVEGAELEVLQGARAFLRGAGPAILLSVHPDALPQYGATKDDVAAALREYGYEYRVLAVDHEEHWWCEPSASGRAA